MLGRRPSTLLVLVALAWAAGGAEPVALAVDETRLRLELSTDPARLTVPVESRGPGRTATLRVEVLDPLGHVLATADGRYELPPGLSEIELALPARLGEPEGSPWERALLDRLRYSLAADDGAAVSGLRAVSQAVSDAFELQATVIQDGVDGAELPLRVEAHRVGSGTPVADVRVEARALSEGLPSAAAVGVTDASGAAELRLPFPDRRVDVTVEVRGRRGFEASLSLEATAHSRRTVLVTPDRPLYLPGQTLRLRLLALDPGQRVLAGRRLWVVVTGPGNETAHEGEVTTSEHGVAAHDWRIPERAEEGPYEVEVREDRGTQAWPLGRATARVRRYELPVFRVSAAPRAGYSLPGQEVGLTVEAQSLTGRPIEGARVRVTSDDDTVAADARTDESGRADLRLDPAWVAGHFPGKDTWRRFEDLELLVTVIDPVSQRSEARRCAVRLTLDALHVYWIEEDWHISGFPVRGWVSVYSADGQPVSADVTLSGPVRARVRTGRNGLARVVGGAYREDVELALEARDAQGRTGRASEGAYGHDKGLRMELSRFLLRPGQAVRARLRSLPAQAVTVEARQGQHLLGRRELRAGPAGVELSFPVPAGTRGLVSLVAWPSAEGPTSWNQESRSVLYPDGRNVRLSVAAGAARARPGDMLDVEATLEDSAGSEPSAVGLAGVDVALLDRAADDDAEPWFWASVGDTREIGGMTPAALQALSPDAPWPTGAEDAAGVLLSGASLWVQREESGAPEVEQVYARAVHEGLAPLHPVFAREAWSDLPPRRPELEASARSAGLELASLRDPWGNAYRFSYTFEPWRMVLRARSWGADEHPGGGDDVTVEVEHWHALAGAGARLQRALSRHLAHLQGWPPTLTSLRPWLVEEGLDPDHLTDPDGQPLRVTLDRRGPRVVATLESTRPELGEWNRTAWTASVDVFQSRRLVLAAAVEAWASRADRLPGDDHELGQALEAARVPGEALLDPDGLPWRAVFRHESRFADRQSSVTPAATAGSAPDTITPITEESDVIELVAARPAGRRLTGEEPLATFRRVRGETGVGGAPVLPEAFSQREPVLVGDQGAVAGIVADRQGQGLPGVDVTASDAEGRDVVSAITGAKGEYVLGPLKPGSYDVRFELVGFAALRARGVEVRAGQRAGLDVQLTVDATTEAVTVTAEAPQVSTSATTASQIAASTYEPVRRPRTTPRLREYFPETLLWEPEVVTGSDGRARVRVRLPDSLTTWRVATLASTHDGHVVRAETQLVAWQPFAVELDPPSRLTTGDRVVLALPLRNDEEQPRAADLQVQADAQLTVGPPQPARVLVPAGGVATAEVELRALRPARAAALEVSASGEAGGDRIRRQIAIVPDGQPMVESQAQVAEQSAARLAFRVPEQAFAGSAWAELRLLPDLRSHVAAAVEGARERPWGCGEQSVSAAFPSLLLLEQGDQGGGPPESAGRYVREAVERLRSLEAGTGGFTYWGWGPPDAAVSAHALRFLARAEKWVPASRDLALRSRAGLVALQRPEGAWEAQPGEGGRASILLTAQVARALAEATPEPRPGGVAAALEKALAWLEPRADSIDEPYLIATLALLEERVGRRDAAQRRAERLASLEKSEGDGAFWDLGTNTPFYGWGQAGRLETTGLVLQVLERLGTSEADHRRADRALLFLLRHQDAYGVWWSGQATVNVLEGLLARAARLPRSQAEPAGPVSARLDGRPLPPIDLPPGSLAPLRLALGDDLASGEHVLELSDLPAGGATLQLVTGHAQAWPGGDDRRARASQGLVFDVAYDRRDLHRGHDVSVRVEAGRVGFRGYGMLVAEVGLPPGADVSRPNLEAALGGGSGLMRYELRPDRVVLYLWPTAGRARLTFTFRPRFGLEAVSAPSRLFDYYNPEEEVLLRPDRFVVR